MRARCGLVVALVLVLLVGACDTTRHRTTIDAIQAPPQTFSEPGLSFTYPAAWHSARVTCPPALPPGSSYEIVYLSNQPLNARIGPGCDRPLQWRLTEGGVLVTWWEQYPIGNAPSETLTPPVTSLRIDGRDVTELVTGPGKECVGDGADGAVAAIVNMGSRVAGFNACMRGPDLKTIRAQVQAMLASVKVTGVQASTTAAGYRCIAAELPVPGAWPAPDQSKLFCTSARVSVPDVLGVPLPRAVVLLNQVGLFVAVKPTQTVADDTARVVAQDPAQAAIAVADSTVVLTASPTDKRKFTAECKDGYSTRVPIDQGACSDHGGVQTVLQ